MNESNYNVLKLWMNNVKIYDIILYDTDVLNYNCLVYGVWDKVVCSET